ncbi:hypothetical protein HYFRA_00006848 [Hymenoscyphus fraxineus]|uniref:Uncharacterized protein n=1 Tax=Hymenoscyphus fraxineus TaxID=746836 RepID=A0A9N9KQN2_9HELO|nr:hypothetical protein HYFRA_00006848 [Hymenoscyphus fraxineus]
MSACSKCRASSSKSEATQISRTNTTLYNLPPEIRTQIFEYCLVNHRAKITKLEHLPALIRVLVHDEKLCVEALDLMRPNTEFQLDAENHWQFRGFAKTILAHIRNVVVDLRYAGYLGLTAIRLSSTLSTLPSLRKGVLNCGLITGERFHGRYMAADFKEAYSAWLAGFKKARFVGIRFCFLPKEANIYHADPYAMGMYIASVRLRGTVSTKIVTCHELDEPCRRYGDNRERLDSLNLNDTDYLRRFLDRYRGNPDVPETLVWLSVATSQQLGTPEIPR